MANSKGSKQPNPNKRTSTHRNKARAKAKKNAAEATDAKNKEIRDAIADSTVPSLHGRRRRGYAY